MQFSSTFSHFMDFSTICHCYCLCNTVHYGAQTSVLVTLLTKEGIKKKQSLTRSVTVDGKFSILVWYLFSSPLCLLAELPLAHIINGTEAELIGACRDQTIDRHCRGLRLNTGQQDGPGSIWNQRELKFYTLFQAKTIMVYWHKQLFFLLHLLKSNSLKMTSQTYSSSG